LCRSNKQSKRASSCVQRRHGMKQLQRLKGRQAAQHQRPCRHVGRSVDGDLQKMIHFILSAPLLRKNTNTNRNHRRSPAKRHASPLVSTHRCKANHVVASQSVILFHRCVPLISQFAMACVKRPTDRRAKRLGIGMRVYESGSRETCMI
jgi:hypothetical protein